MPLAPPPTITTSYAREFVGGGGAAHARPLATTCTGRNDGDPIGPTEVREHILSIEDTFYL
jgi:hypothetical protein